jgi:hypothetical protein
LWLYEFGASGGQPRDYGVRIIGPVVQDPSWQAREKTGFENGAFTIDWERKLAHCPQGNTSRKWAPGTDIAGQAVIQFALPTVIVLPAQCESSVRGPNANHGR